MSTRKVFSVLCAVLLWSSVCFAQVTPDPRLSWETPLVETPTPADTPTPQDTPTPEPTATPVITYGLLHPDGSISDIGGARLDLQNRSAEGLTVPVDLDPNIPLGVPLAYDQTTRRAIPWTAEIQRRAQETATTQQEGQRFLGALAQAWLAFDAIDLDVAAIETDLAQIAAAPDANLNTIAALRAALRRMVTDARKQNLAISRLNTIVRRQARIMARDRQAPVPVEATPSPTP